jgi:TonB-linked SusC/RagA family outer membrane protein
MRKFLMLFTMLMLSGVFAFAQTHTVSGSVKDDSGAPVAYATVTESGTRNATTADANGNFTIKMKGNGALAFSATGYTSTSATPQGNSVAVAMKRNASELTTVVVTTAFGQTRQAKDLGYATAKITTKELTQAKVTDISTGLEGKVSGLQINLTDNGVNPSTRIVLRGNRSLTGNNEALLVLDGVPIDDPSYINKINPEDVDNVTVLKGAVAAAIYGSKASNGVLIITTKHGTKGKPSIVVSNTASIQEVSYLPKLQQGFGGYGGEGGSYINANGTVNPVPYENESYGPPYNGSKILLAIAPNFAADGTTVQSFDSLFTTYSAKPNQIKDFFNKGLTNQFDVNFSSGDEHGTFYMGFQDVHVNGVVPKDVSSRDNIRVGGTREYGRFKADYSVSYNQANINVAGLSYNQTTGGVFSGRQLYFELLNTPSYIPLNEFKDPTSRFANPNSYYNAYATNPYWTIDNSRRRTTNYDILGNLNLSYKITNWFTISDRVGITQTTQQLKYTRNGITFAPWAIADPQNAGNVPSSQKYLAPSEFDQTLMEQRLNNDLLGSFSKDFSNFSIKGFVGFNTQQRYLRFANLEGDNLQFPGDFNVGNVLGIPQYHEESYKQREYSIFEDVTLGYKDFLFLHVSNRDEWNSILDPSNQHFEYPGGDVSFIFTQAINSLKNNKILSYGKIRGGLTQVANINLGSTSLNGIGVNGQVGGINTYGAYSLVNPFVPPAGFPYGSLGGYAQSQTYLNPLIKPEITDEYEVGAELGFLGNRINLSGDYYQSKTKGESLTASISSATGFTQKIVNAGLVTNSGVELDLKVTPIRSKNVVWNVGVNYAHYKNVINQLLTGVDEVALSGFSNGLGGGIYAIKGLPYPVIKANDWVRDSATGKVIVDPITGMPSVDPTAKVFGQTNPTDILGITTSVTFKGFTLSAVADYRTGNYIMNELATNLTFEGVSDFSAQNGRQRFIFPNSVVLQNGKYVNNTSVAVDNGSNTGGAGFWPGAVYGTNIGSPFVVSAAFWKIREVSLVYDFPSKMIQGINFVKKLSVGLVGRNLFMFRPKSNQYTDPEFSSSGSGNAIGRTNENQLPPTRIFGANVTVTF